MLRGLERPPWWALVAMVVGAVVLVVGLSVVKNRGFTDPITADELDRLAAAEAAAATSAVPVASPLDALRADGHLTIYFVGDSLTEGYNATTQEQGFRPVTTATLAAGGPTTEASDFRAGATLAEVAGEATLPGSVDVAVIELGTNNVGGDFDPEGFRADYDALAGSLAGASGELLCLGVFRSDAAGAAVDDVIMQACDAAGGRYVSLRDVAGNPALVGQPGEPGYPRGADGRHPNDAGHAEIAARITGALS